MTRPLGPTVRLVYERTGPPGVDAGVEPLIAVCATEEAAERVREASATCGRYASWEEHQLQGAAERVAPLVDGEVVHVVLLGDVRAAPRDPIGIATYSERDAAARRAAAERLRTGDSGYRTVSLHVGWRAGS